MLKYMYVPIYIVKLQIPKQVIIQIEVIHS